MKRSNPKNVLLLLLIVVLLSGGNKISTQSLEVPLYYIQQMQDNYDLNGNIQFLEDAEDLLTIEKLQDNPSQYDFKNYNSSIPLNQSYTYWVRCKIRLSSEINMPINNWFLKVGETDYYDVYLLDENHQLIQIEKGGTLLPAKDKTLKYNNDISRVPISIVPGKDIILYVRYSRITNQNLVFNLQLNKYDYHQSSEYLINRRRDWMFLGFIITMILINVTLYFFSGAVGFLYHGIFILGVLIFLLDYFGITADIWYIRDHPKLNQLIAYSAIAIIDIGYYLFIKEYLNLKNEFPKWNIWFKRIIMAKFIFFISITIFYYISFNEPLSDRILAVFVAVSFAFAILYITVFHRQRTKQKLFILAGTLFLFLAICFNAYSILNGQGLWTLFTEIGLAGEIVLFSIALAYRMKSIFEISHQTLIQQKEKELDNERKVSERLIQVDKIKDQFLANTTHELQTPLNGIIGITESLKDGIAGVLPPIAIDNLNIITSSSRRLASLVNDLLDFSKLRNNDLKLRLQPVGMKAAADVVIALSQSLLKGKPLQLVNSIPLDVPIVNADENRVQQILLNLIGNAIKFTDHGKIEISSAQNSGMLSVSVSDEGIGIPIEKQEIIFKSFEQFDHNTVHEYGGTGLGLSVTKQLVELHGGTVTVNSSPGNGATFTFTLPISKLAIKEKDLPTSISDDEIISPKIVEAIVPTQIASPSIDRVNAKSIDTARILIIDDEAVNRIVLENHLSMRGYEVTQAITGPQALKILEKGEKFDLIILDIMMPKMSGFEVCQKIRNIYHPSELPVIMLTAKNRVKDLMKGFNVGANDYLTKPFSKDELLSRIKTHLNLHLIHKATTKFVPTEFLKAVGRESITEVKLGDHSEKKVTVFFSDVRGYTKLAEQMSPKENFRFVNSHVGRMGPIISKHGGFVNQYLGDGIMAIFPESLDDALKAAILMQKKLQEYNAERIKDGKIPLDVGMGMHTGSLIMGIIGDENRIEPAIISDTVNTASRMEGLSKHYGANIIVSEDCLLTLKEKDAFHFRFLENVQVKGKNEIIGAYECIDGDREDVKEKKLNNMPLFEEGLKLFYIKEFGEATAVFSKMLKSNKDDLVAQYFMNKAAKYTHQGVPDDWSGVEKFDVK